MESNEKSITELAESYNKWLSKFKEYKVKYERVKNTKLPKKKLKLHNNEFQKRLEEVSRLKDDFFSIIIELRDEYRKNPENKYLMQIEYCETYLEATQADIQEIQSLCIFPITLQLSALTAKHSTVRDIVILLLSIIFTVYCSNKTNDDFQQIFTTNINCLVDIINKSDNKTLQNNDSLNNNSNKIIKIGEEIIRKIDLQLSKADRLNSTLNQETKDLKKLNTEIEGLHTEVKRLNSMPNEKR